MNKSSLLLSSLLFISLTILTGLIPTMAKTIGDNGIVTQEGESVSESVDRIKSTLEEQGFAIVGMIDHAVNAQNVGLNLRPTQLILFSDPKIDAMVIGRSQTSGIDIPQKILVWEDEAGEVRIFYNSPGYLIERHTIKLQDSLVTQLADVLNQFGPLDNGLITVDSSQTVDDTVTSLKNALENQGFLIPFVIDHSENANLMNVELRPTRLIIFGNPNIGTQLMEKEQSIGIDLPQKFLVWEDEAQQVHITYNDPQFLSNRHNVKDLDQLIENIANALKNLAQTGAGTKR